MSADVFGRPSDEARAGAISLVQSALCQEPAIVRTADSASFAELIHCAFRLFQALASRLRTPDAMTLITAWFEDIANQVIPEDPCRHRAAAVAGAHLKLPPALPEDEIDSVLMDFTLDNWNAACEAADEVGRAVDVFQRALLLWAHLMPEADADAGIAVLHDVAAELWPDE
jgi:hypothetical protein